MAYRLTAGERLAALHLLRLGLPIALVVEILMYNHRRPLRNWARVRNVLLAAGIASAFVVYPRAGLLNINPNLRYWLYIAMYILVRGGLTGEAPQLGVYLPN